MAAGSVRYVVDRIEGKVAVLERDDGTAEDIPRRALPTRAGEGSVLRVLLRKDGSPDWATAVLDEAERRKRLKEAEEKLRKLKKSDPGGDIRI